jgi:hypothetical protein
MDHGVQALRTRPLIAVLLLLATNGGCGGSSCPLGLVERVVFYPGITVGCCGASTTRDVQLSKEDAELDLAFHRPSGPPPAAHAWLTTADCSQLLEGDYPPAVGSPSPRCTVYLGPVSPGEVSPRRTLPPGTYRLWVQAFSSSPQAEQILVDVGIWAPQCGAGV